LPAPNQLARQAGGVPTVEFLGSGGYFPVKAVNRAPGPLGPGPRAFGLAVNCCRVCAPVLFSPGKEKIGRRWGLFLPMGRGSQGRPGSNDKSNAVPPVYFPRVPRPVS